MTFGLAVVAFAIRAIHLDWGLPEVYEEATPVREAVGMWGSPGRGIDLNPHFFKYPSFSFYLNFGLQAAAYLWLSITGAVQSLADFRQLLDEAFPRAVLGGRWISVWAGALTLFPTAALGRSLGDRYTAWMAAALLAVFPLAVAESRLASPDVVLLFCSTMSLAIWTRWAAGDARSQALRGGLWMGLATAAKYPGALLLGAAWSAHAMERIRERGGPLDWVLSPRMFQIFAAALVAFAVASPYVILDAPRAAEDIGFERGHMALGHLGREGGRAWGYYLLHALPQGVTPAALGAALLGLGVLLARRDRRGLLLPGLTFTALMVVVLGSWRMAAPRYMLPLLPLVAVWSVVGIQAAAAFLGRGLARGRPRSSASQEAAWVPWAAALLCLGLLAPAIRGTAKVVGAGARVDSRAAAATWIAEQVPAGSLILVERYGPEPDPARYAVVYLPFHGVTPHVYDYAYVPALYAGFDYVVFSNGVSARYLADIREYPIQAAFYRAMEAEFREVASFTPAGYQGPEIRILARREEARVSRLGLLPPDFFASQAGNGPLAEYFSALGIGLIRGGDPEPGFRLLEAAVTMDPENAKAWGNLGAMRFEDGRFEDALTAFRRAAEVSPTDAMVRYNLGLLYDRMGEARQAVEAFQAALLLDRGLEEAYLGLARVLVEDDRYEAARSVLRTFLERFPRSPRRGQAETALEELAPLGRGRS